METESESSTLLGKVQTLTVAEIKHELRRRKLRLGGKKDLLKERLIDALHEEIESGIPPALADLPAAVPPQRPPASLNGADWGTSEAKQLLAQDMLDGIVPVDTKINDIERLHEELHKHQPEFKDFPFDLERYKARIGRLQENVRRLQWASAYDKELLEEALQVYPKQSHGPTGEILWRDSAADQQLDIDMAAGLHLTMKPSELRASKECYKAFSVRRFSKRIDQKKEAAKPHGTNPMQAAAKKKKKAQSKVKNRPEISRATTTAPYTNSE